jgi:hypothetical protein
MEEVMKKIGREQGRIINEFRVKVERWKYVNLVLRERIVCFACIYKFRKSTLSVLPRDIVILITKIMWKH